MKVITQSTKTKVFMKKIISFINMIVIVLFFSITVVQAQPVKGELTTVNGKRVLRVWGSHYDMGYAHGYLLADKIVELLEDYMLGELMDVKNYWRTRNMLTWYFRIPIEYRIEIQGMYDGMVAALGRRGLYSETINSYFKPVDIIAWNMVPEIFRLYFISRTFNNDAAEFCSSISGWGEGTIDGNLVFARNLDFGKLGDLLERNPLIIAFQPCGCFKKDWISIAWPGYISCLTGMNEEGVGAALNLGNEQPALDDLFFNIGFLYLGFPLYYSSITFTLRQGVENIRPLMCSSDPIGNFYRMIKSRSIAGSFDIHVFTPGNSDKIRSYPPAAIIECNYNGTAKRTSDDNQDYDPELFPDYYLAVTNHHRKLAEPTSCWRYDILVEHLNDTEVLDMELALDIERDVAQDGDPYNTAYMAGFIPDTREIWVSFAEDGLSVPESEPTYFQWEDVF